jgi:FAD/FMN-containing dehydrogenase
VRLSPDPASPDPGILDMPQPPAARDQDDVNADVVAGAGVARHQIVRRCRHPRQAPHVDRMVQLGIGGAVLHLDEGD